jgi:hypothetical protein
MNNSLAPENRLWILLAPAAVIAFPFVNLLIYHHYGFFHAEVAVLFLGILIVGLALGSINLASGTLTPLLLSCWITVALVFQLDLSLYQSLAVVLALCVVGTLLRRRLSTLVVAVFATMSIAGIVVGSGNISSNDEVKPGNAALPAYIHIIFDGHIGIEGIPLDIAGGKELKEELKEFFRKYEFTVYDKAYSHYVATINSLTNLFNFSSANTDLYSELPADTNFQFDRPKYFQILRQKGYALRVLHPNYIDYCSANQEWVSFCYKYPDHNLQSISDSAYSIKEKIGLMVQMLIKQTYHFENYYKILKKKYGLPELAVKIIPANNDKMMQVLVEDIKQHTQGYAYILHFLSPHKPFVYDAECKLQTQRPIAETQSRNRNMDLLPTGSQIFVIKGSNTPQSRAIRYQHYFDQVRCGLRWLEQILNVLQEADSDEDAVIVVHGDHGSKIETITPFSEFARQLKTSDYIDTFSTLFAAKHRNLQRPRNTFLALEEILADIVIRIFSAELDRPKNPPFIITPSLNLNSPSVRVAVDDFLVPIPGNRPID